ncbi:glycoside hydrolase N-terminal domain-containing protein, partial [bacterium]|nr:glycoside hydrolase N-terminal domain-containing protein [bacterium]
MRMPATRVTSIAPALRWEDALISGNGTTGFMAMGRPLDELVIVNHEKCWVP